MAEDTEINLARTSGPVPPPSGRLIVKRNRQQHHAPNSKASRVGRYAGTDAV
jgi:hypothetical protein